MIPFARILKIAGSIPWRPIIMAALIIGSAFFVLKYVKTAEKNRAAVVKLKSDKAELEKANADLEAEFISQLRVMEDALLEEREREKDYGENIRIIRAAPDGDCARNSAPIAESLRMRDERSKRDAAR